jgi:hypothetical protein
LPYGGAYDEIYKYDEVADAPIESDLFEPPLTYDTPLGVITLYGQINLAYQSFDDGGTTTDGIVDNGNWNSRLGFLVYKPSATSPCAPVSRAASPCATARWSRRNDTPTGPIGDRTLLRWFEVAVDSPYGTLSAGQGSSASDGTAGLDDSFTFHAGATDSSDGFGSFLSAIPRQPDQRERRRVNDSFDGARRFRLRYDTPAYHGFTLASSYGVNVLTRATTMIITTSPSAGGRLGDVAVRSALGYQWIDNPNGANAERWPGPCRPFTRPPG